MDKDEDHLGYYDLNPEMQNLDSCSYCGEELDELNVVHYGFNKETYETYIIAVNPLPHEHLVLKEGYVKRIELVCNECLKTELGHERY